MPRILFTETRTTRATPPETFEKGRIYDLPVASCDRWKLRGVAVDAPPEEPKPRGRAKAAPAGDDTPAADAKEAGAGAPGPFRSGEDSPPAA